MLSTNDKKLNFNRYLIMGNNYIRIEDVKNLRKIYGISQDDLSLILGLSKSAIRNFENGVKIKIGDRDKFYFFMQNDEEFMKLIKKVYKYGIISEKAYKKIERKREENLNIINNRKKDNNVNHKEEKEYSTLDKYLEFKIKNNIKVQTMAKILNISVEELKEFERGNLDTFKYIKYLEAIINDEEELKSRLVDLKSYKYDKKRNDDFLVTSEELVAFRQKYHLTQKNIELIFGISAGVFSAYERGKIKLRNEEIRNAIDNEFDFEKRLNNYIYAGIIKIKEDSKKKRKTITKKDKKDESLFTREELISFRKKYGFTQSEMMSIFNIKAYGSYMNFETGLPSRLRYNEEIKKAMDEDDYFKDIIESAYEKGRITEKTLDKINSENKEAEEELFTREELIEFRKKYNLSQIVIPKIFDIGKLQVSKAESGKSIAIFKNREIKLAMEDEEYLFLRIEEAFNNGKISGRNYYKLFPEKKRPTQKRKKEVKEKLIPIISAKELFEFRERYNLSRNSLEVLFGLKAGSVLVFERGSNNIVGVNEELRKAIDDDKFFLNKIENAIKEGKIKKAIYDKLTFDENNKNIIKIIKESEELEDVVDDKKENIENKEVEDKIRNDEDDRKKITRVNTFRKNKVKKEKIKKSFTKTGKIKEAYDRIDREIMLEIEELRELALKEQKREFDGESLKIKVRSLYISKLIYAYDRGLEIKEEDIDILTNTIMYHNEKIGPNTLKLAIMGTLKLKGPEEGEKLINTLKVELKNTKYYEPISKLRYYVRNMRMYPIIKEYEKDGLNISQIAEKLRITIGEVKAILDIDQSRFDFEIGE